LAATGVVKEDLVAGEGGEVGPDLLLVEAHCEYMS
jgi:hypothetical protein